jgi:putative membrane protein
MSVLFVAKLLIAIIALEHLYILWIEMFAWETKGKEVFQGVLTPELFTPTKVLAANQGLYNGFLAAGLIWSLLIKNTEWAKNIALFFLGCILIAGFYGALTADKKILFVQVLPAAIALLVLIIA